MKDSELRTRAKALALHIITVCDEVDTRKGRGVLVNQIVRSATSIGANIHEANYAASKADFINKFHIALKECCETEYWIEMLVKSITTANVQKLYLGSDDIAKLKGKRVLIVDDVISTGESLEALKKLADLAGANVVGMAAVLAEGEAANRDDIIYLEELPVFPK
jgi:four helix bundle protein